MPTPPRPLPPELGATFALRRALAAGVTAKRLRAHDLATPFRGVRAVRSRTTEVVPADTAPFAVDRAARQEQLASAVAYAAIMPPHAFIAGRSAAALHGLPVDPGCRLDIGVPAPHRSPRREGIRGRQVAPELFSLWNHEGLRIASPASSSLSVNSS